MSEKKEIKNQPSPKTEATEQTRNYSQKDGFGKINLNRLPTSSLNPPAPKPKDTNEKK